MSRAAAPTLRRSAAFTLIEILMAAAAATMILIAIYGVFGSAMRMRDNATERMRVARLQSRAVTVLRNDLQNARVSGGKLAAKLQGSQEAPSSRFPGYLRFVTTTSRQGSDLERLGDLQQVEYFIADDLETVGGDSGILVRAVNRNLLAQVEETPVEESVLTGVNAIELSFYDGQSWTDTWELGETATATGTVGTTGTTAASTLPQAVRVRITRAPTEKQPAPAAIEILVPWTTQVAIPATPAPETP
ncbi:MAG TPA: type II secretion system protein GspJ [Chthoniobacteraceae bacterium]|jgi:type II secretion system protein J|nr:type II secretion system protein GspJ [Chthoniobacteraceae bacterium]